MAKKKRHVDVPFENIVIDKTFNSRTKYVGIESLAESILSRGLIQDLGGKWHSDGVQMHLGIGFRRYYAIEHIRKTVNPDAFNTVPVIVHDVDLGELRLRNLAENIDRENLSAAELAEYIVKLVNTGMSQRQIAKSLGRPQSWVSYHYKAKKNLGPVAWAAFEEGALTLENALFVADVDQEDQAALVLQVKEADTRADANKIAKAASRAKGKRRAYTNKGRPSTKNISSYVDDISFKATDTTLSDEKTMFYNGMVAAFRIALGEQSLEAVDMATSFFDTDFSGQAKAAVEKEARKAEKKAAKNAARAAELKGKASSKTRTPKKPAEKKPDSKRRTKR